MVREFFAADVEGWEGTIMQNRLFVIEKIDMKKIITILAFVLAIIKPNETGGMGIYLNVMNF